MAAARYVQGSIMQHLVRMTASGGFGLLALFAVDFMDLFFISLLGRPELTAALGFTATLLFFNVSVSIGLSVAVSATVSRALGARDLPRARQLVGSSAVAVLLTTVPVATLVFIFRYPLLRMLGAEGEALEQAAIYLSIMVPAFPVTALGMSSGGVLRALGDAKGGLWLTLSGAIANAILDPIFIFALEGGVAGAAAASVISRFVIIFYGARKIAGPHRLTSRINPKFLPADLREIAGIALPAVLTSLSTPIAVAFITATMAGFGDAAVAGNAIVTRLQMVAFVGLFALSGVVGPVAGQNWGAGEYKRVRLVLTESLRFILLYNLIVCSALFTLNDLILFAFQAPPAAHVVIETFTHGVSLMFIFNGITFVTNALFNNLGTPLTSTVFNFARATVFTIPFVWIGARFGGPAGILIGQALGAAMIGTAGWFWCRHRLKHLAPAPGS